MKTKEEIIQELNNWVETQNNYGSIRNFEDKYEYIDLLNNEFTAKYDITNNPEDRINVYPEHLDIPDVGIHDDFLTMRINRQFQYDLEVLNRLGTLNELKPYLDQDNYLTILTDHWYAKMKNDRHKKKIELSEKNIIIEKLKGRVSKELYLQVWKEFFNKKQ